MSTLLAREFQRDYGVTLDARCARIFARLKAPPRAITSAARYVGVCRSLARQHHPLICGEGRVDGRLVAVGWNHVPPTRWLEGELQRWLDYWERAADRPDVVGSTYNPDPLTAYRAMRMGVPATAVRQLDNTHFSGRSDRPPLPLRRLPRRRIQHLVRAARAIGRSSMRGEAWRFATKTLAALGRLCPELQRVAVTHLQKDPRWLNTWGHRVGASESIARIRIRDIPWDAVARAQAQLAADSSGRVRAALSTGKRRMVIAAEALGLRHVINDSTIASWLCPSYPRVSLETAARLALGENPVAISDGALTSREAHRWLKEAPEISPTEWLQRSLPAEIPPLRDILVVRWVLGIVGRGKFEALTATRTARGPHGQERSFRYIDRIDEIQACDLVRGAATGVHVAFERAAERFGSAWLEEHRSNHKLLRSPPPWRLYRKCMRYLLTPAQLIEEGQELGHCVGTYVQSVEQGQSVIVAINVLGQRSTLELGADGRCLQHRGHRNGEPPELNRRVVERFLRRIL